MQENPQINDATMKDPTSPILHEIDEIDKMIQILQCKVTELFENKGLLEESLGVILVPEVGEKLANLKDEAIFNSESQKDSSLLMSLKELTFNLIALNERMIKLDKDLFEMRRRIQI